MLIFCHSPALALKVEDHPLHNQAFYKNHPSRTEKNHDSQRRVKILRLHFSLSPKNRAIFSTFWGDFLTHFKSSAQKAWRKKEKIQNGEIQ